MANENAVARPPIQWGRILLSAVLTVFVAVALVAGALLVLGQNPGGILDRLCQPLPCAAPESTGNIIEDISMVFFTGFVCAFAGAFVCGIVISLAAVTAGIVLAVILSIVFVRLMIRQRRLIHWVLTVLLSVVITLGLLFLLSLTT